MLSEPAPMIPNVETGAGIPLSALKALLADLRRNLDGDRKGALASLDIAEAMLAEAGRPPEPSPASGLLPWQVARIIDYVEKHLDRSVRTAEMAAVARLSASHFTRAFNASFGLPPYRYLLVRRMERAKRLLAESDSPISQIALRCGQADQAHFSRLFRQHAGMTPGEWSRRAGSERR